MPQNHRFLIIERILRDRDGVWRQIAQDRDLNPLSLRLLASSAVALAGYGAVLGASNSWLQALSSAVKLPLLFFVTLAICLPTLYLFNLVFGAKLSIRQALCLVAVAINVISMLSVAFAPISLFFLVTAPHYLFFKLLNVSILALTGLVGLRFLVGGMASLNLLAQQPVPPTAAPAAADESEGELIERWGPLQMAAPARPASMGLLYMWVVVFGFVGTQMAWTLRPFLGNPDQDFEIFRAIEGNFYVDIIRSIAAL